MTDDPKKSAGPNPGSSDPVPVQPPPAAAAPGPKADPTKTPVKADPSVPVKADPSKTPHPSPHPNPAPSPVDPDVPPHAAVHGKYLLLDVPNFNLAGTGGQPMRSYLRLGAVDPAVAGVKARSDWGEDLAVKGKKHTRLDGVDGAAPDNATRSLPYRDAELVFEDDVRARDPGDHSMSLGERAKETARLHTKGGWRDHSDGNRITTTRGDKVEVIRGNYKLVVIGRQNQSVADDDDSLQDIASGFDMSGGEVRGMGMNLGEFETTSVEWVQDDNGRYRFVEKNQKGDTYSIYWGDQHEEFFGEWNVEITGSEDPSSYPHVVPGTTPPSHVNPKIVSKTWAESIEEYTGSAKRRIPSIKSVTYAEKVEEHDDILHGVVSNTIIGAGTVEATTIGAGTVATTTIGGGTVENTVIGLGTLESTIIGGGTVGLSIVGLGTAELSIVGVGTAELSIVGVQSDELSICPLSNEIAIGNTTEIAIGDSIGLAVGNKIDLSTGQYNEIYMGVKNTLDIANLIEIFIGVKTSILLGPYMDLKLEDFKIKASETKLGSAFEKLGFKIDEG